MLLREAIGVRIEERRFRYVLHDQCPAYTHTAHRWVSIEILKVTNVFDFPAVAVIQIVGQADQLTIDHGN